MMSNWYRDSEGDLRNDNWEHTIDGDYVPKGSYHNLDGDLLYPNGNLVPRNIPKEYLD